ncbi:MAG: chemotaxis protein CheA [Bacteroidetes bacterium]|nr:chemotaxis protein CheA [Bacteroidota bacterium]
MDNEQTAPGFDEEMREIFESYLVEAREILEHLSQDLLALEKSPSDTNVLNNIFREMHTLKGTSSFLGFSQIAELAHTSEDLLNKLRKGECTATSEIVDVLIEAHKTAGILLQRIESRDLEPIEMNKLLEKLRKGMEQSAPVKEQSPEMPKTEQAAQVSEIIEAQSQHTADTTIRVDVSRLDDLMNLIGELVLARNRLSQATQSLIEKYERLDMSRHIADVSSQIDFVTTELQMAVMKTRMVPIEKVFSGLPLVAREVMRTTGKEVDLQIYGKETELDKSIIEELKDPLIHMIRNAVDHGIELPEERKKLGKSEKGIIVVNAERDGNYILITMEDDGTGMDIDKIKKKALEKGLISEIEAAEMSKNDALNLIFLPGFSTKKDITSVSGRGVGMDVVKTNIAKLKGIVEIDSNIGTGTIITLKVPLTLAIIQGLLLKVADEIFAVPLSAVLEIVRISQEEIFSIQGREVIRVRDSVLPLARMVEIIGKKKSDRKPGLSYVVIVGWAEKRIGLLVDSLQGQKEVVIKTLGEYLGDVPGIAGSTILGDGSVILVIDVGRFIELIARHFGKVA